LRDNTSHSKEEKNASAAALSKHDPTRPIDCLIPIFWHSLVNRFAVYVDPRSVWKISFCASSSRHIACIPPRVATAISIAAHANAASG